MAHREAKASDGLVALNIKPHTLHKLFIIERYIDQFTRALKPTGRKNGYKGFEKRNYLDLCSGPGLCVVNGTGDEVNGTSLIAASTDFPFSKYYFVDINPNYISALQARVSRIIKSNQITTDYHTGDCNQEVPRILNDIDKNYSINLAVIDGFGIECKWSTIKVLASCKRMDLIILFPQGMAINRNLRQWAENDTSALDAFFGTRKWRDIYKRAGGQARQCIRPFLDLYKSNLANLGYSGVNQVREVLIRSNTGHKLYYLLFASRHPLGNRFWKQATSKDLSGQMQLFSET
jgi:three-Cys-motif partner protein